MLVRVIPPLTKVLNTVGFVILAFLGGVFVTGLSNADPAPTLNELKNASYSGIEGLKSPIKLVDGRWKGRPHKKGSALRPVVNLVGDLRVTGDLEGDGTDEAVVLLDYAPGGTGQLLHLAVVARRKDKIENVATAFLGDRVQIRDVRIEQNRILVDVVQTGPNDAMCCPGEVTTLGWTLEPGGKLNPLNVSAKPRRLTLETIGNTEWILRSWDFKEPAAKQPIVTLVFKDGRFAGSSGCNSYFAPAKEGLMPGDLEVGPLGTTRKSCPDNEMSVERRFLDQLARVQNFSFLVGQLALSWEQEGVWKTMLFQKRQPHVPEKQ
jgi:heat shock protein HslJ